MTEEERLTAQIAGAIAAGLISPIEPTDEYSVYKPDGFDDFAADRAVYLARAIMARVKERK